MPATAIAPDLLADLATAIGAANVLTGPDTERFATDWMRKYQGSPVAVVRPGSTAEVAACVKIAAAHGVHPAQVALAWVMAKGVTPICMSTKAKNLASNLAATDIVLTSEDMAALDRLSQPSQRFCEREIDNPIWDK